MLMVCNVVSIEIQSRVFLFIFVAMMCIVSTYSTAVLLLVSVVQPLSLRAVYAHFNLKETCRATKVNQFETPSVSYSTTTLTTLASGKGINFG